MLRNTNAKHAPVKNYLEGRRGKEKKVVHRAVPGYPRQLKSVPLTLLVIGVTVMFISFGTWIL